MSDIEERLQECVDANRSFILDAGAGAGKTYSLVQTLRYVCSTRGKAIANSGQQVACITFTNNAKDQVIQRVGDIPILRVSTIHDFLWHVLSGHQRALKRALMKYNDQLAPSIRRKQGSVELAAALESVQISYSDSGANFLEGRLFHDDLIEVAAAVFRDNALLSRLVAARYPVILVDEYQDTSPRVVDILVGLIEHASTPFVVGLFGDKLQHIYDGGVGELPAELAGHFDRIVKEDNRRCAISVIDLLNRLRTDIRQFPAHDNVPGAAIYVHCDVQKGRTVDDAVSFTIDRCRWTEAAGESTKYLYLTHRVIARYGGYANLLAAYAERGEFYRERLLSGQDSRIAFFLDGVEPLAEAWRRRDAGATLTLLRKRGFRLSSVKHKSAVVDALDEFNRLRETRDVRAVLDHLQTKALLVLPDDLSDRLAGKKPMVPSDDTEANEREALDLEFYSKLFAVSYKEVVSFTSFFTEHTPFSTKHGVKGAEFDTVYVVLDDRGAAWNRYAFDKYLDGRDEQPHRDRFERTRNLFYVCCSRAKKRLAVVDLGERSPQKSARVDQLFGGSNCYYL